MKIERMRKRERECDKKIKRGIEIDK